MEITNHNVYNLDNAIRASKYPMASDVSTTDCEITNRVRSLGKTTRCGLNLNDTILPIL